jgi:tetraacyldisaccharide 4'-kinase
VGNLTVGGTGKTPFVRFMAETMKRKGFRPGIVSRGYRAEEPLKRPLIVSNGERVLTQADQAGDEPQWLAEQCTGIPVVVHPNRQWAGLTAIRMLGANLVVLDDGFQHDRLRRKLDVVLWDVCDEPRRMRLIPAGRLREGLGALRRASAVVLTHAEYLPEAVRAERIDRVIHQLKRHAPAVPIFESETRIVGNQRVSGRLRAGVEDAPEGTWPWSGRKVLAISGLARPQGFEAMLRASGAQVVRHLAYPDHYAYHEELIEQWREAMKRTEAEMILTTTKDAVKLATLPLFGLPILAVEIAMAIKDEARWDAFLDPRVEKWKRQYGKRKIAQEEE